MDLFNGRSRNPTLRLASDRAPGRDATLASVREQRAKRELEAKRRVMSLKIQAAYRGHLARRRCRQEFAAAAAEICETPVTDLEQSRVVLRMLALLAVASLEAPFNGSRPRAFSVALHRDALLLQIWRLLSAPRGDTSAPVAGVLEFMGSFLTERCLTEALHCTAAEVTPMLVVNVRRCVQANSNISAQRVAAAVWVRCGNSSEALEYASQWLRELVAAEHGLLRPDALEALLHGPSRAAVSLILELGLDATLLGHVFSQVPILIGPYSDPCFIACFLQLGVELLSNGTPSSSSANAVTVALVTLLDRQRNTIFDILCRELAETSSSGHQGPSLRFLLDKGMPILFSRVLYDEPQARASAEIDMHVLDALCRCFVRPYASFVSISLGNRAQGIPYISALVYHRFGLIRHLFAAIQKTSKLWALRSSTGELVLQHPYIVLLFTHLCRAFLATSDLDEFQCLIGGQSSLQYLVKMLRDTVFLALSKGHAGSDPNDVSSTAEASTLFVAASAQLLGVLHTVDQPMGLVPHEDWLRFDFALPPPPFSAEHFAMVESTVNRYRNFVQTSVESSDSDDDGGAIAAPAQAAASNRPTSAESAFVVLQIVPFVVPFEHRVLVFSSLLDSYERHLFRPSQRSLRVRRGFEFVDLARTLDLHTNPAEVAHIMDVRFVDQNGREELGYGRGVYRDWLFSTVQNGFDVAVGLFRQDSAGTLEPNPHTANIVDGTPWPLFAALGRLLGRAIQDGVLVNIQLSSHFRNLLLGRSNTIFDLRVYDSALYRHLKDLKDRKYTPAEIENMGLTFSCTEEVFGEIRETALKPGGERITVTQNSVVEYVHLYSDYVLNRRNAKAVAAFRSGLYDVIPENWLRLFDSDEFLTLIKGRDDNDPLDISDWQRNTTYQGCTAHDPAVRVFWDAVKSMSPSEQRELLRFATSSAKAPLLGFSQLYPRFTLVLTNDDPSHLPTAATCFCTLRIPRYTNAAQAKEKITQAAANCATFEMS